MFNIGNTGEVTIRELAERVKTLTGSESPIQYVPYDQAYEAGFEDMPRRVPDISKIRGAHRLSSRSWSWTTSSRRVIEHIRQK